MSKKVLKWFGGSLAVLLLVILIALVWLNFNAGSLAKDYVEENSMELVGRKLTMSQIKTNLIMGKVQIDSFTIKEKDGTSDFVYFDSLGVEVDLLPLLKNKLAIRHIHLNGADVKVFQRGTDFNFTDIIDKFSSTDADSVAEADDDTTSFLTSYDVCDIQLNNCSVHYADLVMHSHFDINNLNLGIPAVYFDDKSTDVGLNLAFDDGGSLSAKMLYDMATSKFDIKATLDKFPLAGVAPYMRSGVRVGKLEGSLFTDMHMVGDFNHIMDFDLSGVSSISNLLVTDDKNELVFSAEKTSAELKNLNLNKNEIHLGNVSGRNMKSQFVMLPNGSNNFTYFTTKTEEAEKMKEERQERRDSIRAAEDSLAIANNTTNSDSLNDQPIKILIDSLNFTDFNIDIHDKSNSIPFDYQLGNTCLYASNFTLDGQNDVKIRGNVGKTGKAFIRWKGSANDLSNQNIMVNLTNIDLTEFTPYFAPMFAYDITSGNMSLVSQNVISNNLLKGSNVLNVYSCKVKKDSSVANPEIKAPLKTALYIIKDKNDRISINLPISGSIDSPEFSYKKIILQTFVNLLVKVATSPFKSIGNLLGLNAESLESIEYDPSMHELDVQTYDKLNQLADMLKQKPELNAKVSQCINYDQTIERLSVFEMKKNFYLTQHPEKQNSQLEVLDIDAILNIADKNPQLQQFLASVDSSASGSLKQKSVTAYSELSRQRLSQLAQKHGHTVSDYLINTLGLPAQQITVKPYAIDSANVYSGKSMFKIELGAE